MKPRKIRLLSESAQRRLDDAIRDLVPISEIAGRFDIPAQDVIERRKQLGITQQAGILTVAERDGLAARVNSFAPIPEGWKHHRYRQRR